MGEQLNFFDKLSVNNIFRVVKHTRHLNLVVAVAQTITHANSGQLYCFVLLLMWTLTCCIRQPRLPATATLLLAWRRTNPKLHACANIAQTFLQHSKTCPFSRMTNWDCCYSCVIDFCQTWCKIFSACFIFIKWSSINCNLRDTFAKKTADMDLATESQELTLLTCGNSYWSGTVSVLWEAAQCGCVCVCVCVVSSQHAHSNSALTALYITIKWTCYNKYYLFIGQWDILLSELRLEFFFFKQKNVYHTFIVVLCIY